MRLSVYFATIADLVSNARLFTLCLWIFWVSVAGYAGHTIMRNRPNNAQAFIVFSIALVITIGMMESMHPRILLAHPIFSGLLAGTAGAGFDVYRRLL